MYTWQSFRLAIATLSVRAAPRRHAARRPGTFLWTSLVLLLGMLLQALPATAVQAGFDHEHTLLTRVLAEHVYGGLVSYGRLKRDDAALNAYLQGLDDVDADDYQGWTRQQKLALWINAYNAYTIRAILDQYPIEHSWLADPLGQYPDNSIRQIRGVWDDMTWPVMGEEYTLNHMEHVILRSELDEPRVHFVLVCASIGCPMLESRAFAASDLEQRLEQAGSNYIYDSRRVRIDRENGIVGLPQIYKWFVEDFEDGTRYRKLFEAYPPAEAGILSWVYRYANPADREYMENNSLKITYLYYDWALNDAP